MALAQREIDKTFGDGYAAQRPEVLAAVVAAASSDFELTSDKFQNRLLAALELADSAWPVQ